MLERVDLGATERSEMSGRWMSGVALAGTLVAIVLPSRSIAQTAGGIAPADERIELALEQRGLRLGGGSARRRTRDLAICRGPLIP